MKNFIKLLLSLTFILSLGLVNAFASTENTSDENYQILVNGQYVDSMKVIPEDEMLITPSKERINSDGTFAFKVSSILKSTKFQIKQGATSIRITSSAKIYNVPYNNNLTSSYPNHSYEIILYKDGLFGGRKVESKKFTADGYSETVTYSGLSSDETYYLKIINNDYLPGGLYVVGNGKITNYVHP